MPRVALVTGGTRGIGAAIARGLAASGHKVAATYAGNKERAESFSRETGIAAFQWDVGEEAACAEGAKRVEAEVGPIEDLGHFETHGPEPGVRATLVPAGFDQVCIAHRHVAAQAAKLIAHPAQRQQFRVDGRDDEPDVLARNETKQERLVSRIGDVRRSE